ncbi:MAG TPA: hypothetical protein VNF47_17965 [Streptosporangiaceae bacterium]|nr:hypothetical protein [Streptosporangiaceae bacterium]
MTGRGQPLIWATLLWTVPASLLVSVFLVIVQLAVNVHGDETGKSIGPVLLLYIATPVVLPFAVAAGYFIARVWTAAAWLSAARPAGRMTTSREAFATVRGLCRRAALAYAAGTAVLAGLLLAGSVLFGSQSHGSQTFQAIVIAAGPTGVLAPTALAAVAALRRPGAALIEVGRPPGGRLVLVRIVVLAVGAILWLMLTILAAGGAATWPVWVTWAEFVTVSLLPTIVLAAAFILLGRRNAAAVAAERTVPAWPAAAARVQSAGRARSGRVVKLILLACTAVCYAAAVGWAVSPVLLSSLGSKIVGALFVSTAFVPAAALLIGAAADRPPAG